jgi:UBX domain-containing protein 1
MSGFASMADMRSKEDKEREERKKKGAKGGLESYSGGEKSGMAVFQPGEDISAQRGEGPLPQGAATVTIYADGFTVNDGPFRAASDPANKKFVDDVLSGVCPEELANQPGADGQPVHIAVNDKRSEKHSESAASGSGGMSGGRAAATTRIVPNSADMSAGAVSGPVANFDKAKELGGGGGENGGGGDDSKKMTKLMFRFGDGRRLEQSFWEEAQIEEVFRWVEEVTQTRDFRLVEGFPPQPLLDRTQTLKEKGLLKAQLTVKS